MTSFVGKGTDIARALDNALLFSDPKAEYLPGIVHVEFSGTGIAFSACDDYATGRDRVGEVTLSTCDMRFEITEEVAENLRNHARSARAKAVLIEHDAVSLTADGSLMGPIASPEAAWNDILPLIDVDAHEPQGLPATVAFNATRFARFGRVKALKDAPMDIRFLAMPTDVAAPIAVVKIGPTFRGEIQGVRREAAKEHLGAEAQDCFW